MFVPTLPAFRALGIYDAIIAFSQEYRCIWKKKYGVVTVLYLVIRYGAIINMALRVSESFLVLKTVIVSRAPLELT